MIVVDANLPICAVDSYAALHQRARQWLEAALSADEAVGSPWIVLLALLRVTTRPRILARQLPVVDTVDVIDDRLGQPS